MTVLPLAHVEDPGSKRGLAMVNQGPAEMMRGVRGGEEAAFMVFLGSSPWSFGVSQNFEVENRVFCAIQRAGASLGISTASLPHLPCSLANFAFKSWHLQVFKLAGEAGEDGRWPVRSRL